MNRFELGAGGGYCEMVSFAEGVRKAGFTTLRAMALPQKTNLTEM
jgi:hypothetical protein